MNEKYLTGVGAGLILISFGIIVSYLVASGVEGKAMEENQTISFEQLSDIPQNTHGKLKNNPATQEFRKFIGDSVEELKGRIIMENSTLHSELKNSTEVNGTE